MQIGNITVYPLLNINPTLQKRFGKHWSASLSTENLLQRINRLRTVSSGFKHLTRTKNHIAVKVGVTYNFSSGKPFSSPRIEKNADTTRLTKD